uniref:Uncharacterized protein n=1 Tax=Anopheles christyi TaxID=43041 RepID=A0A182KE10_9DIPT
MYFSLVHTALRRIGSTPDKGVPDMTCISDIDENGINRNLKVRYERDQIYVSFSKTSHLHHDVGFLLCLSNHIL